MNVINISNELEISLKMPYFSPNVYALLRKDCDLILQAHFKL